MHFSYFRKMFVLVSYFYDEDLSESGDDWGIKLHVVYFSLAIYEQHYICNILDRKKEALTIYYVPQRRIWQ